MGAPMVLVVDDEPETRRYLRLNLEVRGYDVVEATGGREALEEFDRHRVNLVLLDILMPDLTGYQVCHRIRKSSDVPVVFLSGKAQERDIVKAFETGADDFMTKPFGVPELMARVRAALRRVDANRKPKHHTIVVGDLAVDVTGKRVWRRGNEVPLTATEIAVLALLAKNADLVLTHRFILENVWGPSYEFDKQYIRAYIYRLRSKLEDDPDSPKHLISVPGVGYLLTTGAA